MAEFVRPGTEIRDFIPDDTDDEFYIATDWTTWSSIDLVDLQSKIVEKWPNTSLFDVTIQAKHIHTSCLGYDRYDASDYTNYLVIQRKEKHRPKTTRTMFYVTRFEHNPDVPTQHYRGGGLWVEHDPGKMGKSRLSLRLYENEEVAKAVTEHLTETDWHSVEINL